MHSHCVKPTRCFVLLVILLGLLLGTDALAQDIPPLANPLTLDLVQVDNTSGGAALDGFVTNDLLVNSEDRLLGFQMILVLEEGSIYQDPYGTDLPPSKIAVGAIAPSLAFDTFLAVGSPFANGTYGVSGPHGKAVNFWRGDDRPYYKRLTGPPEMNDQVINVAWSTVGGEAVTGVEDFLISRVTLSDDASGYWAFLGSATPSQSYTSYHATVGLDGFPEGVGLIEGGVMDSTTDINYHEARGFYLQPNQQIPTPGPGDRQSLDPPISDPPHTNRPLRESLSIVQRDNTTGGPNLAGFKTNDFLLDTTNQLSSFQLYLELEQGQIFQDPVGGHTAPPEGLAERGFPSLEFDTFVAVGTETAGGPYGTPGVAGGAVNFGASSQVEFDDDTLSIVWYGTPGVPMFGSEDFLLSRVSLSDDAIGSWDLRVSRLGKMDTVSGTIENGLLIDSWKDSQINEGGSSSNAGGQQSQQDRFGQSNSEVPEPGTCALAISALGLFVLRRRQFFSSCRCG